MTGLQCPSQDNEVSFATYLLITLPPSKADNILLPSGGTARHSSVSVLENKAKGKGTKAVTAAPHPDPPLPLKSPQKTAICFHVDMFEHKKLSYFSKFPVCPSGHHSCLCQKYSVVLFL